GSVPLGFLAASLGLMGWADGAWPAWFPLLVFSPFLIDASVTLVARLLRGERPWRPHNEHLYQRMVRSGLGHRRTALIWYGVMLACAVTGSLAIRWPFEGQIALLGSWAMFYAAAFGSMRRWAPSPPR
ncbi:MAG: glycosyl transferase, partial [Burkholderiaceae bacterium]